MLDLNDPRWNNLSHAYGSGADVPLAIHKLASSGSDEEVDSILGDLMASPCHQGGFLFGGFGNRAASCLPLERRTYLSPCTIPRLYPGNFEVARKSHEEGPGKTKLDVPDDIRDEFLATIKGLPAMISATFGEEKNLRTAACLWVH